MGLRFAFVAPVLVLLLLAQAPARAQELSSGDRNLLERFDKARERILAKQAKWSSWNSVRSELKTELEYPLSQVSEGGQRSDAWQERKRRYDELMASAAERFGVALPAPAGPAPDAAELKLLEEIDRRVDDRTRWASYADGLRLLGKATVERTLAEVEALVERIRPEVRGHAQVTSRTKNLPKMREDLAKAFAARPFVEPRPSGGSPIGAPGAAALEAWREAFASLSARLAAAAPGQDELALRLDCRELLQRVRDLGAVPGGQASAEGRTAAWEVARLDHHLDGVFGRRDEMPGSAQAQHDRLGSIVSELERRIWPDRVDELHWQDEARVRAMHETLAKYRAELDALAPRFRRTADYLEASFAYRRAIERLDREVAAAQAKAAQAGDVDGQLAAYQRTFPSDGFDPSFQGVESVDAVRRWGQRLRNWRDGVDQALAFFARAREASIKARSPEFQAYVAWFQANVRNQIERAVKARADAWRDALRRGADAAAHQIDAGDTEDAKGRLLASIEAATQAARLQAAFRAAWGEGDAAVAEEQVASLEAARARLLEQAKGVLQGRRLPDAASKDAALLAVGRERVAELVGEGNFRGLRVTAAPWRYDYTEISGDYLITTWWEAFRVDFAARRRKGGQEWFHESFVIQRRLDSAGNPISAWAMAGDTPGFSLRILPENAGD